MPGDKWVDRNAGPVVRPYALTGGRTQPTSGTVLDLIAVIVASTWAQETGDALDLSPEHRRILGLCRGPATYPPPHCRSEWSAFSWPISSARAGSPFSNNGPKASSPVPLC